MPDHRNFICPDNAHNRQQHADLENLKSNGWRVIDAGRDPMDANVMIITLTGTSGTRGATRSAKTKTKVVPKAKQASRGSKTKKQKRQ